MAGRRSAGERARRTETRATLREAALRYLSQRESTVARLKQVLERRITRAEHRGGEPLGELRAAVDEIARECVQLGYLDDARFAQLRVRGMRGRGDSRRKIERSLQTWGVDAALIQAALESDDARSAEPGVDAELEAARLHMKKKRIGAAYPRALPADREERFRLQRRWLASLARAGFSYGIAKRALEGEEDEAGDPEAFGAMGDP